MTSRSVRDGGTSSIVSSGSRVDGEGGLQFFIARWIEQAHSRPTNSAWIVKKPGAMSESWISPSVHHADHSASQPSPIRRSRCRRPSPGMTDNTIAAIVTSSCVKISSMPAVPE